MNLRTSSWSSRTSRNPFFSVVCWLHLRIRLPLVLSFFVTPWLTLSYLAQRLWCQIWWFSWSQTTDKTDHFTPCTCAQGKTSRSTHIMAHSTLYTKFKCSYYNNNNEMPNAQLWNFTAVYNCAVCVRHVHHYSSSSTTIALACSTGSIYWTYCM